jgi:hypothetical protein
MTTIYLKYGTYSGTTLTWSSSQAFNALKFIDYDEAEREITSTLRGYRIANSSFTRTSYDLEISAAELTNSTKLTFIKAFFKAHAWKFSLDNWTSEKIVVVDEKERIPWEFLEGNKLLKKIKLKLIQKAPD